MLLFYLIKYVLCFFKQKTAYEMRISDWSSDVCSSDLSGDHLSWCRQCCSLIQRSAENWTERYYPAPAASALSGHAECPLPYRQGSDPQCGQWRGMGTRQRQDVPRSLQSHIARHASGSCCRHGGPSAVRQCHRHSGRSEHIPDRKSTRLNSSHSCAYRMPSSA